MRSNFKLIMSWLAVYEGGYVNHPKDPGGATNRGVTQRVYHAYLRRNGRKLQSVRFITDEEHDEIYRNQYWRPVRGDDLPSGLDATVFDFAVNSGVSRSARTLQKALGMNSQDGIIGEMTLAKVQHWVDRGLLGDLIIRVNNLRLSFMKSLRTWVTFGKGWKRRVVGKYEGVQDDDIGVVDRSIMLYQLEQRGSAAINRNIPKPKQAAQGKAEDSDASFWGGLLQGLAGLFRNRAPA